MDFGGRAGITEEEEHDQSTIMSQSKFSHGGMHLGGNMNQGGTYSSGNINQEEKNVGESGNQGSSSTGWVEQPDGSRRKETSSWSSWSSSSQSGSSSSGLGGRRQGAVGGLVMDGAEETRLF